MDGLSEDDTVAEAGNVLSLEYAAPNARDASATCRGPSLLGDKFGTAAPTGQREGHSSPLPDHRHEPPGRQPWPGKCRRTGGAALQCLESGVSVLRIGDYGLTATAA